MDLKFRGPAIVPGLILSGLLLGAFPGSVAHASVAPVAGSGKLVERLGDLRSKILDVQQGLIDGLKTQKQAQANVKKIQLLMKLQQEEKKLGQKRLAELEATVSELESRRDTLRERVKKQQAAVRKFLAAIHHSRTDTPLELAEPSMRYYQVEKLEAPRRKLLANMVDRELKDIEALKVDLADSEQLEGRIQEERQQLVYLFQDLNEQESVLELNRQLQVDLLKKKHQERAVQLENYRKLKAAEGQGEHLLTEFNARLELERTVETERAVSKAMMRGVFARQKGQLPLPVVAGRIVSNFGRSFDPRSGLFVFKKGVEISAGKKRPVKAIAAGKIAFSGELPDYGRVAIVDHGDHFYSLCAHLGELSKKVGDPVAFGDALGETDDLATPVYFEIRARNVAVNPMQWLAN